MCVRGLCICVYFGWCLYNKDEKIDVGRCHKHWTVYKLSTYIHPNGSTCDRNFRSATSKRKTQKNAPEILFWKENFSIFFRTFVCLFVKLFSSLHHIYYTYFRHLVLSLDLIRPNPKQIFAIIYTLFFVPRLAFVSSPGKCPFHKRVRAGSNMCPILLHSTLCVCVCVYASNDHISLVCVNLCRGGSRYERQFIWHFMAFVEVVKHFRLECFIESVWFFVHIIFYLILFFLLFSIQLCTWHMTINSICGCMRVYHFAIKLFIFRVCFVFLAAGFM